MQMHCYQINQSLSIAYGMHFLQLKVNFYVSDGLMTFLFDLKRFLVPFKHDERVEKYSMSENVRLWCVVFAFIF